ncbi:MAG TPA: ATP-dependent zinc metalloprotease FtsH [Tepidisphaeraceae bacterium]|jgi:cell division protease FtsH|nr:ATP-dependent zinc metalloprotease FtsH [Tepidisphaeraceae bacterium]
MAEQRPERPNKKQRPSPNSAGGTGMRFGKGLFGWLLFIGLAIMLILLVKKEQTGNSAVSYSEFLKQLKSDNVQSVTIEGSEANGDFVKDVTGDTGPIKHFRVKLATDQPATPEMIQRIADDAHNARVTVEDSQSMLINVLVPIIPWLLIFGFIYVFVFRQLRNSAGAGGMLGNFGRSKHKITSKEHTNITFDDVAGVEEAKEEVMEIVEFLKNPKKFQRLGGRIPRGLLLVGEPGTGKTLLAKAIAGEADAPFFSISGSDFVEMFVGVGASRVRDLFKQAKDNSPCIIFLDEIDAVGRRRGSGFSSGGHDEREQTLNAILVEMDGFETNDQVIVCAATNRVDVLDPALTRPGRFDRQVYVPLPDVKGRAEILKVHSRKVKLGPNVDMLRLARATPGFSGADLAAIINEAALGATMANKDFIEQDDLEEARDKVRWGRAKKSRVIDEKDKLATAYHEAGHAVIQYLERPVSDPIHKVTVIPRGNYGGVTMALPEKDRTNTSRKWSIAWIKMGVAGRIAEEMFTGDINTGAYGDIRQVTGIARKMVRDWGMNERVGFIYYGEDENKVSAFGFGGREYSEETAKIIDEEVKKLVDSLEAETKVTLEKYRPQIEAMAQALLKYETLDANDVERIMRGETISRPNLSDLLDKEQGRRGTAVKPPEADVRPGFSGLPAPG